MPQIVYWPGRVGQGVSDALISQVDFPATLGAIGGANLELPADAIPDSFELSATLLGESPTGRATLIEHASSLALRKGKWKYIKPSRGPAINRNNKTELGNSPQPQLYNLEEDPGETKNLASKFPDKVEELQQLLEEIRSSPNTRITAAPSP